MLAPLLFATLLRCAISANASPTPPAAIGAFAAAWSAIDAYSATLTMHEIAGARVQDRTYAFTFRKPSSATISITSGPGRGGKVVWSGGDQVTGSPAGLFSAMKLQVAVDDARVTSLRGDTVIMASFGWLLDHFRHTPGVETQTAGSPIDGKPTTAVVLAVSDPSANAGITRDVLLVSDATKLPVEVRRYVGTLLVKDIRYSDIVIGPAAQATDPQPTHSTPPLIRRRTSGWRDR